MRLQRRSRENADGELAADGQTSLRDNKRSTANDDAPNNLPWLYAGRALRSFATAFLTVIFPLYLALNYHSSTAIGAMVTLGSILGGVLGAAVGLVSDAIGRRPVLIALGILGAAGSLALAFSADAIVVVLAFGLGGIGRGGGAGSGGTYGPFFPAEQPMIATSVPPQMRTRAYGVLGFIGVLAAAAGSLAASSLDLIRHLGFSADDAYRLMFAFGAIASLAVAIFCMPLREQRPSRRHARSPASNGEITGTDGSSSEENEVAGRTPETGSENVTTKQLVSRMAFTNGLNGFGFGFLGPLLIYWFYVRFGVGTAEVGLLYTVINLVGALPYLGAHRISNRLGAVRTVVGTRMISVLLLLAMAPAPTFIIASVLLGLRTVCTNLGMPARQAYTMGVADERRRGTVAAFSSLPAMATSSISPVVGGALMNVFVDVPIVGAAFFMAANTIAYYLAFRHVPLPGEISRERSKRTGPG